jgi:hypothetical protein
MDLMQKWGEWGIINVYLGYYTQDDSDLKILFSIKQISINAKFEVSN